MTSLHLSWIRTPYPNLDVTVRRFSFDSLDELHLNFHCSLTKWFIGIGENVKKWTVSLTDVENWRNWLRSTVQFQFKRQTSTRQKRKSASKGSSATGKPEHIDSIDYRRDDRPNKEPNTSPAYEVFKMDDFYDHQEMQRQWHPSPEEEHFAASEQIRRRGNRKVKFRVGQVMKHKIWGYKGVIVGWDEFAKVQHEMSSTLSASAIVVCCQAPESWLRANHRPDRPVRVSEQWCDSFLSSRLRVLGVALAAKLCCSCTHS